MNVPVLTDDTAIWRCQQETNLTYKEPRRRRERQQRWCELVRAGAEGEEQPGGSAAETEPLV